MVKPAVGFIVSGDRLVIDRRINQWPRIKIVWGKINGARRAKQTEFRFQLSLRDIEEPLEKRRPKQAARAWWRSPRHGHDRLRNSLE